MGFIELTMSHIAGLFLLPVFLVLAALFAYALFELGRFLFEIIQRKFTSDTYKPLTWYYHKHPQADVEQLELHLLKQLEPLRVVSRISPMLGLIATMIPMGPALMGVASGNFMDVAENLSAAFSAVIIALLSASMVFWVLSVRRRWLLEELKQLALIIDRQV